MEQHAYLEDLTVGESFASSRRTVGEADIANFSLITGDYSPLHSDEELARAAGMGGRIAQGWLVVTIQSGLRSQVDRWSILAYLGMERSFRAPVRPGDTIHARYRVAEVRPSRSKPDRGVVTVDCEIVNQHDAVVADGHETFLVAVRPDT